MTQYLSLSEELSNNIIIFVDGFGEIIGTFDFIEKKPYYFGKVTNDIEIKLINKSTKSKYNKMLNMYKDYYYGEFNNEQYNNIMGKFFKIIVQNHIFVQKYEYILLIIDNPYYDSKSENFSLRGKYKLIIYSIRRKSIYIKYLKQIGIYTSSL